MNTNTDKKAPDYGEPWTEYTNWDEIICRNQETILYPASSLEHCARAIQCVNACAGMTDPAAELAAMREAIKEAFEALQQVSQCRVYYEDSMDIDNHTSDACATAVTKLQPFLK